MKTNRCYSLMEWKSVDEDKRLIEGIASTPTPDRLQDIVELDGMSFSLPLPFLRGHSSREPIGKVVSARKTKDGLLIKAQIAAAGVAEYVDESWRQIKAGLIGGLSIGFRSIEEAWNKETGGYRFIKTELYEVSAVVVPANAECNILTVKSIDSELRAASGNRRNGIVRLDSSYSPGVSGKTNGKAMTIQETISASEAKLAAHDARIDDLLKKSMDAGTTPEEADKEEIEDLKVEKKKLTDYVALLREREAELLKTATRITKENTASADKAADTRQGREVIQVRSNAPRGIGPARMAIAMWNARGNAYQAADLCTKHWPEMPELAMTIKAIVEAADTTTSGWASQLVPAARQLQEEFLDMYRAATIINQIPGIRRVPFNVAVPLRTGAGTFQWVGEAAAKPVTSETFDRITLTWAKAAAITVITKELAKFSSPDAEMLIRDSMIETLKRFFDEHFVSATAAVSNVSPAGLLNGATSIAASGTTAAALRTDLNNLLNNFTALKIPRSNIVLLMSETNAQAVEMMVTDLGVALYPSMASGTLFGRKVIVSETAGTNLIAINARDILLAEDPAISVDVSDQATLEMETTPAVGEQSPPTTQSVLKSMFQNNLLAIRCEQFITWAKARTTAVQYISNAAYLP